MKINDGFWQPLPATTEEIQIIRQKLAGGRLLDITDREDEIMREFQIGCEE
jgi:hypothetical protein